MPSNWNSAARESGAFLEGEAVREVGLTGQTVEVLQAGVAGFRALASPAHPFEGPTSPEVPHPIVTGLLEKVKRNKMISAISNFFKLQLK